MTKSPKIQPSHTPNPRKTPHTPKKKQKFPKPPQTPKHTTKIFCLSYWWILSYRQSPCHTERSEVSINLRCEFAYLKRGFFCCGCALQPVGSPFCKRLKMTKSAVIVLKTLFVRHCERAKRAWQSTKKQCYHLEFKQKHKFCHINEIVILSFCQKAKYP